MSGANANCAGLPLQNRCSAANGSRRISPAVISRWVPLACSNVQRPDAIRWKTLMWRSRARGVLSSQRSGLMTPNGAVNEPPKNTEPVSRTARSISDSTSGTPRGRCDPAFRQRKAVFRSLS